MKKLTSIAGDAGKIDIGVSRKKCNNAADFITKMVPKRISEYIRNLIYLQYEQEQKEWQDSIVFSKKKETNQLYVLELFSQVRSVFNFHWFFFCLLFLFLWGNRSNDKKRKQKREERDQGNFEDDLLPRRMRSESFFSAFSFIACHNWISSLQAVNTTMPRNVEPKTKTNDRGKKKPLRRQQFRFERSTG